MTYDGIDIALLDWGIGGLGVYRELVQRNPNRRALYISDAGATPYGAMTSDALAKRILSIAGWLRERDIARLVIACNAASTVLPSIARRLRSLDVETTGVIEHGITVALQCGARSIAIIGGSRTIKSGVHARALRSAGIDARGRDAQPLSARVEQGDLASDSTRALIDRVLEPVRSHEALLLACTHYTALRDHFERVMPAALILDPAAATAESVGRSWPSHAARNGDDIFITTGDAAQMRRSAQLAFGLEILPRFADVGLCHEN